MDNLTVLSIYIDLGAVKNSNELYTSPFCNFNGVKALQKALVLNRNHIFSAA